MDGVTVVGYDKDITDAGLIDKWLSKLEAASTFWWVVAILAGCYLLYLATHIYKYYRESVDRRYETDEKMKIQRLHLKVEKIADHEVLTANKEDDALNVDILVEDEAELKPRFRSL